MKIAALKRNFRTVLIIAVNFILLSAIVDGLIYAYFRTRVDVLLNDIERGYYNSDLLRAHWNYFTAHPIRGFDHRPNAEVQYFVSPQGKSYTIWSNRLGCYDKEVSPQTKPWMYLAGDSYSWGYVPYEQLLGVLLEKRLGRRILKCGVGHTGQRHQFHKFKEIYGQLKHKPKVVLVNISDNDFANDYSFPHDTAMNGKLLLNTFLEPSTGKIFRSSREQFAHACIKKIVHRPYCRPGVRVVASWPKKFSSWLYRHSAMANLIKHGIDYIRFDVVERIVDYITGPKERFVDRMLGRKGGERLVNLYHLIYEDVQKRHPDAKAYESFSRHSKDALSAWNAHAKVHGYRLVVAFLPTVHGFLPTVRGYEHVNRYFAGLRVFLAEEKIPLIESHQVIEKKRKGHRITWPTDYHMNVLGHWLYADVLEDYFKRCGEDCELAA